MQSWCTAAAGQHTTPPKGCPYVWRQQVIAPTAEFFTRCYPNFLPGQTAWEVGGFASKVPLISPRAFGAVARQAAPSRSPAVLPSKVDQAHRDNVQLFAVLGLCWSTISATKPVWDGRAAGNICAALLVAKFIRSVIEEPEIA